MNVLDIIILVLLALFAVKGALRGLLKEICSLLGLAAAAVLSFSYYAPLAKQASAWLHLPLQLCVAGALLVLFALTMLLFSLLGALLSRFIKLLFLGGLNRVFGALFSLAQGALILALVLYGLSQTTLPTAVQPLFKQSQLRPPFVDFGGALFKHSKNLLDRMA